MSGFVVAIGASSFGQADPAPLELLRAAGCAVRPNPHGRRLDEDEVVELLRDAQGLIAGLEPLTARVLKKCRGLKAIARVGIGMDNVDQGAAERLGIRVSNTPDAPGEAVAELTLAALLAIQRGLVHATNSMHAGRWEKAIGRGLGGTQALVIGGGRIGRRVTRLFQMLGMEVVLHDPWLPDDALPDGVARATFPDALATVDVVSLHASGRACVLGAPELRQLRDDAILLNSARGELVDEAALIDELERGRLRGVWFDAFWQEPYDGLLRKFDRVLMTPHIGTYTVQCRREMELAAVHNVLRDLQA